MEHLIQRLPLELQSQIFEHFWDRVRGTLSEADQVLVRLSCPTVWDRATWKVANVAISRRDVVQKSWYYYMPEPTFLRDLEERLKDRPIRYLTFIQTSKDDAVELILEQAISYVKRDSLKRCALLRRVRDDARFSSRRVQQTALGPRRGAWCHDWPPTSNFLTTLLDRQRNIEILRLLEIDYEKHRKAIVTLPNLKAIEIIRLPCGPGTLDRPIDLTSTLRFAHINMQTHSNEYLRPGPNMCELSPTVLASGINLSCLVIESQVIQYTEATLIFPKLRELRICSCDGVGNLLSQLTSPALQHFSVVYSDFRFNNVTDRADVVNDFLRLTTAKLTSFLYSFDSIPTMWSGTELEYDAIKCHRESLKFLGFEFWDPNTFFSPDQVAHRAGRVFKDVFQNATRFVLDFPRLEIVYVPGSWICESRADHLYWHVPGSWARLKWIVVRSDNHHSTSEPEKFCQSTLAMICERSKSDIRLEGVVVRQHHHNQEWRLVQTRDLRSKRDTHCAPWYNQTRHLQMLYTVSAPKATPVPSGKSIELLGNWFPYSFPWMTDLFGKE